MKVRKKINKTNPTKNSPVKKTASNVLNTKEDKMKRTMSYRGCTDETIVISTYNKTRP